MAITSDLIGRIGGGGGNPFETVFPNAASGFTINLPDGEWGLVFQFPDVTWSATQVVQLTVNGQYVGHIGGSGAGQRSVNASILVRHMSGTISVSLSNGSGRVESMAVVAFPDPTP